MCLIGKDSKGNWIVQGPKGKYGGLSANRFAASQFAMFEAGTPHAAVMVPVNMAQGR